MNVVALVDADIARAQRLAETHGVGTIATDVAHVSVGFDAAIVATPSFLHAPMAMALVERGIHVLVEKPIATDLRSAVELVEAAERVGTHLHVGQMHRFFDNSRIVRELVHGHALGAITEFSLQLGMVAAWTTVTSYATERQQAGGGVLIDLGSHALDLVHWWFGTTLLRAYRDDARGGVEAECQIEVLVNTAWGLVPGIVVISRLRSLRNSVRITGADQILDGDIGPGHVRLFPSAALQGAQTAEPQVLGSPNPRYMDAFVRQLEAFVAALNGREVSAVGGRTVLPTLELILQCYSRRQALIAPWEGEMIGVSESSTP